MLSTVVVFLQTQAGTDLDHDALNLEALSLVDAVVPTPGAVHFAVKGVFFTPIFLQGRNNMLDILTKGLSATITASGVFFSAD
jgi:hypothetical protein